MCVPGHPITADVDLFRASISKGEQDQVDHGDLFPRSTSSTSSCICCVTPASCVYLRSEAPQSTSHLVQVSSNNYLCENVANNFSVQVKISETSPDPTTNGIQYGRLLTKLSAPIGSTRSLLQLQLLLQVMTSMTVNELPLNLLSGDLKTTP